MKSENKLLNAKIYHKRFEPKQYDFMHNGFFLLLDLDNIEEVSKLKLFGINRINFFSLFYKDYGYKEFNDTKKYILGLLEEHNAETNQINKILLLTIPRIFGFVFNPVSFWLCLDKQKNLILSVAEVNNTFGERHSYICKKPDMSIIKSNDIIEKEKLFHVSPFFEVKGNYKFKFHISKNTIKIDINYFQMNKPSLTTYISGNLDSINDLNLAKYIILYPFLTLKVIILIHYHALKLWIKGMNFFKKPKKPKTNIS